MDNICLLGDDKGILLCRRSQDEGITWSNPVKVLNLPEYMCSNVDYLELLNMTYYALIEQLGKGALSIKIYIIEK